ncbi:MAG: hypothetical protein NZ802_08380, partial [Candidatus Poseidoniales archaeon]|nr:hypothetical protein [Candidatus Poseidoniales archaeon]
DTVDWTTNPFFVPTKPSEWPLPKSGLPRRAGVSAFGFGGTNFHVALEAYDPEFHLALASRWDSSYAAAMAALGTKSGTTPTSKLSNTATAGTVDGTRPDADTVASILDSSATPSMTHEELKGIEGSLLLLNASDIGSLEEKLQQLGEILSGAGPDFDDDPVGRRLSVELPRASKGYSPTGVRMALVATSWAEFKKRVELALKAMNDQDKWGFLAAQGVMISSEPPISDGARIAHLYPGQGSQYVGMTLDLSKRWSAIGRVWKLSDETMVEVLEGESLSSFVLRENLSQAEQRRPSTNSSRPSTPSQRCSPPTSLSRGC